MTCGHDALNITYEIDLAHTHIYNTGSSVYLALIVRYFPHITSPDHSEPTPLVALSQYRLPSRVAAYARSLHARCSSGAGINYRGRQVSLGRSSPNKNKSPVTRKLIYWST